MPDQKNFIGHTFNIKLEEKSYKMIFKALSVKIQWSIKRQGCGGGGGGEGGTDRVNIWLENCSSH